MTRTDGETLKAECDGCGAELVLASGKCSAMADAAVLALLDRTAWTALTAEALFLNCPDCGTEAPLASGDPTTGGGGCKCCGSVNWREVSGKVLEELFCPGCAAERFEPEEAA